MAKSYAQRIADAMPKYLAMGYSDAEARKAARGHGNTGEHGVTITAVGNEIVVSFRSEAKLAQALRAAEKYGGRAALTIVGKNGKSVTAFQNKGHLSGRTVDSYKSLRNKGQSLFDAVGQAGGDHYDLGTAIPDGAAGVAEYQLIVY